jgi:hypothetical protein
MEKRAEPRFDTEHRVYVTTLRGESEEFTAWVQNLSKGGMRLLVGRRIEPGVPLKVEWDDTLLLGDVCYCEKTDQGYAIGLQLEHSLKHTGELARLSRRLLEEAETAPHGQPQPAPIRKQPDL